MSDKANPGNDAGTTTNDSPGPGDIDLLELATAADSGQDVDALVAEKTKDAKQTGKVADTRKGDGKGTQDGADKGSAGSKKDDDGKGEQKKPDAADKSANDPKAKDEERKAKSWEALNAEKEATRKAAADTARRAQELDERERRLAEREKTPAKPPEPSRDAKGRTATDYEAIAKQLDEDGETAAAKLARARAAELKAKDEEAAKTAAAPAPVTDWNPAEEAAALIKEDPELQKPENPVVQEANRLLKDPQWGPFLARKGGVSAAVVVSRLTVAARESESLREQLQKTKGELEELQKATGMTPSPAAPKAAKSKKLSDDDMLQLAQEADAGA